MIGPFFEELSPKYATLKFLKVDVDQNDKVAAECGISAMPTFQVWKAGQKIDELVGASKEKLEALCAKYSAASVPQLVAA
jgi:thioredoxin 1